MKYNLPSKKSLRNAILVVMKKESGAITVSKMNKKVYDYLNLPDEVIYLEDENGLDNALDYRMRWVRTEMKKDGILDNPARGLWEMKREV